MTFAKITQGTTRPDVTFYPVAIDLLGAKARQRQGLTVETEHVVNVTVRKTMAGHTFTLDLKERIRNTLLILDGDWVDISFITGRTGWFQLRGIVDAVSYEMSADGGVTERVIRVAGRGHERIFSDTQIWYDIHSDGALSYAPLLRIFEQAGAVLTDPATTVETILAGFIKDSGTLRRGCWVLPEGLPGTPHRTKLEGFGANVAQFVDNCVFFDRDFLNYPGRFATAGFMLLPGSNQSVWDLARHWSDPGLCELYTDYVAPLYTAAGSVREVAGRPAFGLDAAQYVADYSREATPSYLGVENQRTDVRQTALGVIYRDRPFPTTARVTADGHPEALDAGPWSRLAKTYVPLASVRRRAVTQNGRNRANAFFAAPRLLQEAAGGYYELCGPTWNKASMSTYGFRRFDVVFDYVSQHSAYDKELADVYRTRIRDFYALNHLFLSGVIDFVSLFPTLKLGTRLCIDESDNGSANEYYYIEGIAHSWSYARGGQTSVSVSRGWAGEDAQYYESLVKEINEYSTPFIHTPGESRVQVYADPFSREQALTGRAAYRVDRLGADALDAATDALVPPEEFVFPPFSAKLVELFTLALNQVPAIPHPDWADPFQPEGRALHTIVQLENEPGWVGYPNVECYGSRPFRDWPSIWDDIRNGLPPPQGNSTATGLGQVTRQNVVVVYPGATVEEKLNGIGNPIAEARGMLNYIINRPGYGTPSAALAFRLAHKNY